MTRIFLTGTDAVSSKQICKFAALVCFLALGLSSAHAQKPSGHEKFLFDAVNRERVERELQPLQWDAALAESARRHTVLMARHKTLTHQLQGEPDLEARVHQTGARYSRIAENIGEAPEVSELHSGWMHSPPHAANILSPQLTSIGIAVEQNGSQLFATQDFSAAVADLSLEEQEEQIGKQIKARGLRVSLGSSDARKECEGGHGYWEKSPVAVTHFETPDLRRLPDELNKIIARGRYSAAAVGACQAKNTGGFTRFRVAVLFY